ncbi:hypothetical protein ANN_19270 [Periplaneta americana]|uniref:DUF4817 domain-containing protein n=1 Tax=Periplaneta americana TaxID=6978 RepID=A0ABQ8S9E9_PERAM|nr:hypothetical protein ANN_19270 [Periplaneta americana]
MAARFDVLDGIEDEMMYLQHVNHCGNNRISVIVERSFPDSPEASKAMIYNLVKKFHTTGSVLDKKRTCMKSVLTEKMSDEIGHRLDRSPTTSSCHVAQQVGVSQSSVIREPVELISNIFTANFSSLLCYIRNFSDINERLQTAQKVEVQGFKSGDLAGQATSPAQPVVPYTLMPTELTTE